MLGDATDFDLPATRAVQAHCAYRSPCPRSLQQIVNENSVRKNARLHLSRIVNRMYNGNTSLWRSICCTEHWHTFEANRTFSTFSPTPEVGNPRCYRISLLLPVSTSRSIF